MESRFIGYKNFMTENALQYKRGWATDGDGSDMKFFKKIIFTWNHGFSRSFLCCFNLSPELTVKRGFRHSAHAVYVEK